MLCDSVYVHVPIFSNICEVIHGWHFMGFSCSPFRHRIIMHAQINLLISYLWLSICAIFLFIASA